MAELSDLIDVTITSPQDGHFLVFDPVAGVFVNKPIYQTPGLFLEQPAVAIYPMGFMLVNPYVLESISFLCASGSGTATAFIRNGGGDTAVTGITGVAFSSTPASYDASATPTIDVDESLVLSILTVSSALDLTVRAKMRRSYA